MNKLTVAAAAAMTLAGCAGLVTADLGDKSLVLTPQIIDSAMKTQQVLSLYTSANVNHLVLELYDGATLKATKDIASGSFAVPVTFSNLKNNKTYTVNAAAYKAAGTAGADKISVDASSSMTITTTTDNAVAVGTIPVKLVDVSFNGTGTNSIAITPGVFTYPAAENMP